jgi:hypothetical protein
MKASHKLRDSVWLLMASGMLLVAQSPARAAEGIEGVTAVASRVSKGYVRTRLPDGSFQPEEYAFGNGGRLDGPFRDASIDNLGFLDVARVIASALRAQNYIPAKNLKTEKLLIMVHWGTTAAPDSFATTPGVLDYESATVQQASPAAGAASPAAAAALWLAMSQMSLENMQRKRIDFKNAMMLGYDSEDLIGTDFGDFAGHSGVLGMHRDELLFEIEENRYFVVLIAYDFQLYWKEKKLKALWETRFSINEPRNFFDKALPAMAQYASNYFGQDSNGLLRKHVPGGQVEVGEPTLVEYLFGPKK